MKLIAALLLVALFQKPEIHTHDLEHRIHELINDSRKANSRESLKLDEKLSHVAREHSEDMAKHGYFDHRDPDGNNSQQRIEAAGISCRAIGENIFQNNLYTRITISGNHRTYDWSTLEEIASSTVKGWMNSPGHRQNIVSKSYTRSGVGVAFSSDDKVFITQVFCD